MGDLSSLCNLIFLPSSAVSPYARIMLIHLLVCLSPNLIDRELNSRLHLAAWSGHAQVVNYLCKNKADVGAAAMDDMGAVHFAAQKGHLEVVRILLTSGVSVKSANRKGMTALHYAAQGSNLELVKYLVKKGANISVKNKAVKTPIDLATNEDIRSFLHECETTSIKEALSGGEKSDEAQKSSSVENAEGSEVKADEEGDGEAEDVKDESVKRKADGEENQENPKETKKAKVALNHLLASDDVQEEEEEGNL